MKKKKVIGVKEVVIVPEHDVAGLLEKRKRLIEELGPIFNYDRFTMPTTSIYGENSDN